ncbi:MAG: DNA internalization-related competence protein ComEC/Rec2 [Thiotrichales bacterium]
MLVLTLGFLSGAVLLHQSATLPGLVWVACAVPALLLVTRPRGRGPAAAVLGFCWALAQAHWQLYPALDEALIGKDMTVDVRVVGIPDVYPDKIRFVARPLAAVESPQAQVLPERILLTWYRERQAVAVGEVWRLRVRLREPRGFSNPGGFDYERWLFEQGIRALGSVRVDAANQRLAVAGTSVDAVRADISQRISARLGDDPQVGVIKALALGMRQELSQATWQTFIQTGTNHLMAISGLHIGLVALLSFALVKQLWRWLPRVALWLPAQRAGALASLLFACGYALLAGFSIPTQRALIMQAVIVLALWFGWRLSAVSTLAAALLAVLVYDSLAVLAVSFWLSFGAVAWLLWLARMHQGTRGPRAWVGMQLGISVGLLPLTVWFFGQGSVVSPLANLLAVPWVSFLVVPLVLLGVLALGVSATVATALFKLASLLLGWLLYALEQLAALPHAFLKSPAVPWSLALLAFAGLVVLFAPRGLPMRWLGVALALPLMAFRPGAPREGELRVTVIDVGQGLSVVAQTRRHTLVYDTGPAYSPNFTAARSALLPYLQHAGVRAIDRLVISHDDRDHSGDYQTVLEVLPVGTLYHSQPAVAPGALACLAGEHWTWDGVEFRFLHPSPGLERSDNDMSCVLQIRGAGGSVLLTGDIGRGIERDLVQRFGSALESTVLVAPHHGSRSSSSAGLIAAVRPEVVVYSAGYRNHFRFPHPEVVARYEAAGAKALRTDLDGALTLDFRSPAEAIALTRHRDGRRRYWHRSQSDPLDTARVSPDV